MGSNTLFTHMMSFVLTALVHRTIAVNSLTTTMDYSTVPGRGDTPDRASQRVCPYHMRGRATGPTLANRGDAARRLPPATRIRRGMGIGIACPHPSHARETAPPVLVGSFPKWKPAAGWPAPRPEFLGPDMAQVACSGAHHVPQGVGKSAGEYGTRQTPRGRGQTYPRYQRWRPHLPEPPGRTRGKRLAGA